MILNLDEFIFQCSLSNASGFRVFAIEGDTIQRFTMEQGKDDDDYVKL